MAAPIAGSPSAPSSRARGVGLFAAFVGILLVLSSVPLMLSPPVGLTLGGPALVAADEDATFSGRFSFAGFAMRGALVEVRLDGETLARTTTAADGAFVVGFAPRVGPHTLEATASPGRYTEASTQPLTFRAVRAPAAPTDVQARAAGDAFDVVWRAPAPDADRVVQLYRVYAHEPGEPWAEVASVPGDVTTAPVRLPAGASVAVAAANVAGESAWGGPVTLR